MKRPLLLAVALVAIWIVAMFAMFAMSLVAGVVFGLVKFAVAGLIAVVAVRYLAGRIGRRGELSTGRRRGRL